MDRQAGCMDEQSEKAPLCSSFFIRNDDDGGEEEAEAEEA